MTQIFGVNNPGNGAHVDLRGRVLTSAVMNTDQDQAALDGLAYNLNTGNLTLTSDVETPLFFVKNTDEIAPAKASRVFFTFGASTGGSGTLNARVIKAVNGGTLLSGDEVEVTNFNFGSARPAGVETHIGGTGVTAVGEDTSIRFLFSGDGQRHLIGFETIVLPRGASMAVLFTPPAGNTSIEVQSGLNFFFGPDSNRAG